MELDDFRKDFLETIRAVADAEGDFEEAAFVGEAARRLGDAEELFDFEPVHFEGTGSRRRKLRVDGYSIDEADGSFRLVIADYRGEADSETLTQTEANFAFGQLQAYIEDSISGRLIDQIEMSAPGYGLASLLHQHRLSISRFRLYLLTDANLSARVKDLPPGILEERPVEYHIWDMVRFHRVFESTVGLDELEVDFREFCPGGLPCLEAGQTGDKYQAWLCVIPGSVLAEIYDRYGSRLLEGNVRSFLMVKGKVNKGIQGTLRAEPGMFFAYNNGIAVTATDAEVVDTPAGLRLVRVSYPQIVNGGQTTASLLTARHRGETDLNNVAVQMKLSVVRSSEPDGMNDMIQSISRYANSQNKVSDADFFANHPFHRRMEAHSRRIWAPAVGGAQYQTHWFYERARGQYLNAQARMKVAERKTFERQNPRTQVITKTDLAKFETSWAQMPHEVSKGAQKNFLKFAEAIGARWTKGDAEFSEEYFTKAIARAILFRHTERMVSSQTWYQNGYRANIVAYTIAMLSLMIERYGRGKVMDFRSIWNRQGVSEVLDAQLAVIARVVFDVIVAPEGVQNVTEWCKKELCWQRVQAIDLPLLPRFVEDLADRNDARAEEAEARAQQKQDNGISAQSEVVSLGSDYWRELKTWANRNADMTPSEISVIGVAARIPDRLPSDKQSTWLLSIRQRIESEGFRYNPG
jgi:hypothetical protein